MNSHLTRRSFLAGVAGLGAGTALLRAASSNSMKGNTPKLAHLVFFWLKNPDSKEDLAKLLAGIKSLEAIPTLRGIHVGVPAETEKRPVIDSSYSASELLFFDDIAGQNEYQVHPLHQKFVKEYSPLWSKVLVYDSIAV